MLKPVIAGTALLALAGSSFVYAQQGGFGGHGGYGGGGQGFQHRHHRLSAADFSAFADARIAALKAGLELTPDQAKNWPPFEQAVRDLVQLRVQRIQARQAGDQTQSTSPFDRMAKRADNMGKTSAALKKIADAGAPLYQTLDDSQKGRFMMLARMLRPHHHMRADNGQGWRHAEGYGRGGDGNGWNHGRFDQNGGMQNDGDQGSKL
jgi:LTXXQ motif family protein